MAWNTEETRRRLKEAAVAEFAEHGPAGTRMDRIAGRAGINKERLYNYFGDKNRLFQAVLIEELEKMAADIPLGLEEPGEYAARCFDYHAAHPHLVRLLQWEALEYGRAPVPHEEQRLSHYGKKIAAFEAAQRAGHVTGSIPAADLVFMIISLSAWWFAVPQVARMLTGYPEAADSRRESVIEAARRLAGP
ncbi:TetR family transcriptional regulator [Saccharothrix violaceirubra]|uniref:AcrR family transcriptional regulator n=1 Tax=Saccharothrix violaceirubra TaxID=413306 RepID=A0A7W7T7V5_9PSEU|nr:TetR family transcriptional regulator [Saccharothrix violaceirubra]MBB4967632.1 AcrR family transcriptional regulator [Saccharothrix violaceirubra]